MKPAKRSASGAKWNRSSALRRPLLRRRKSEVRSRNRSTILLAPPTSVFRLPTSDSERHYLDFADPIGAALVDVQPAVEILIELGVSGDDHLLPVEIDAHLAGRLALPHQLMGL